MGRVVLKWLGIALGGVGIAAAVFLINLVWFRPFSLDLFYEKLFVSYALQSPETLTRLGMAERFGFRRHNAHLDDLSLAKEARDLRFWRDSLADLQSYDYARQSADQQLSTRVLTWYVQDLLDGEKFRHHDYPVNPFSGVQNETIDFLLNQHQIDDHRGAEDFLARLEELPRKFDQLLELLQAREREGIVPPRFAIERVLTQMRGFESRYVRDNPLYVHFSQRAHELRDAHSVEVLVLQATCATLVETSVRPAFRKLIAFLEAQLQRATDEDGVWKLPDGDAYYAWRLRSHTTTDLTPQQVHDIGLAEVARIEAQMHALLAGQRELRTGETPQQAMARLGRDPRFLYPDDDDGRQAALADYQRMLEEQLQRSRAVIGLVPRARVEVRRVPVFTERTAPAAYYTGPALFGTRPGVFWVNLRDMNELPKFAMRTHSLHAAVPGHHLQISLAQERKDGPTFRKVLSFSAYAEGWGLYAEWLGTELGVYRDDPWSDLGRLQGEIWRAARLVVDTGIHFKRWTRAQGIAYLQEKTGLPEATAVSEVERYIVAPGQACAYTIGMLRLQAARHRAQAALGPRFDAEAEKAFHDKVLEGGQLPLGVLDEQIDAWVRGRLAR